MQVVNWSVRLELRRADEHSRTTVDLGDIEVLCRLLLTAREHGYDFVVTAGPAALAQLIELCGVADAIGWRAVVN
jgi:anti-anti-sigma regulatory factor